MTSKCLIYISRETERKLWRNNKFGGEIMNSELDMVSLRYLGPVKMSRKPLEPGWAAGTN